MVQIIYQQTLIRTSHRVAGRQTGSKSIQGCPTTTAAVKFLVLGRASVRQCRQTDSNDRPHPGAVLASPRRGKEGQWSGAE